MSEETQSEAYKAMYHKMFHAMTAAQASLMEASIAIQGVCWQMKQVQAECEETYLQMTDDEEPEAPEQS